MTDTNFKGEISEWNEGNFKSLRLHQAQEIINFCTMNPFKKNGNEWNYKIWFNAIVVLFKEGMQKYSTSEYTETNKLKDDTEEALNKFSGITKNSNGYKIDMKQWTELKKKLEEFEYKAKSLNDKHGLSTRNVKYEGLF